jgi:DNA adenine methylase
MSAVAEMTTTALVNYYGSNRIGADRVGREMGKCEFAGVVFVGGYSEVPMVKARQLLLNDANRAAVNLGRVTSVPALRAELEQRVAGLPFHPDVLASAQRRCMVREAAWADWQALQRGSGLFAATADARPSDEPDLDWAVDYFVASWMGRGSQSGTDTEFTQTLSVRFNAGGGGSSVRFRSAAHSLAAWGKVLERAEFTTMDFREFLGKCHDKPGHAIYADPPFPEKGDSYKSFFGPDDHRDLCRLLGGFSKARVVIRYHEHPLIRELYPRDRWTWVEWDGRTQTNGAAKEVLILNGPSLAGFRRADARPRAAGARAEEGTRGLAAEGDADAR